MKKLTEQQLETLRRFKRSEDRQHDSTTDDDIMDKPDDCHSASDKSPAQKLLEIGQRCTELIRGGALRGNK